jgi:mRNA interferase HigB
MRVISNKALREFAERYPVAESPLKAFRQKVERGAFLSFADLREAFVGVDKVGERFVFNIGCNKFRLIAAIQFAAQRLYVKAVLTHADYDEGDWK